MIDNRGGAGGLIAAAAVAKAEPDGYTLLMASAAQVTIPPWINRSLSFDPPRDLVPVAHLADTPMVLIVSSSSKAQTVGDFVADGAGQSRRRSTTPRPASARSRTWSWRA